MEPQIETTLKVARNIDSSLTQIQQLEMLILTLLKLEAIKINAYSRWQPFFNEGRSDFLGFVAYLRIFHNDTVIIDRLKKYFTTRVKILHSLRRDRKKDVKLYEKLKANAVKGNELMEELREKIYALQMPVHEEFHTVFI